MTRRRSRRGRRRAPPRPTASRCGARRCSSLCRALGRLAEHRLDQLLAPGEQIGVAQRRRAERHGLPGASSRAARPWARARHGPRHRYEHRTHCRLEHRPRVQPLHPDLLGVGQLHRREPDVVALLGDVGQPGPAGQERAAAPPPAGSPPGPGSPRTGRSAPPARPRCRRRCRSRRSGCRPPAAAAPRSRSRAGCARRPAARSGPRRAAAGPSPRSSRTASPIIFTYRSKPTAATCPDCSPPSRLPAPRISRSFIAMCMPAPIPVCCGDGGQPLVRRLGQRLLRRVQEVGVAALPAAADPAAQLVQGGQPVGVGPVHDQRVGVRDVQARTPRSWWTPARRTPSRRTRP